MHWTRKHSFISILLFMTAAVFVGGGYFMQTQNTSDTPTKQYAYLQGDSYCVRLEVANTQAEKRKGLSGRSKLEEGEGMMFVYDEPDRYGFWMKDMQFAIDIIWTDGDGQVVTVKSDARPDSYPKTFYPTESAKNVIEVRSGFTQSKNINSGDRLEIISPTSTTPRGCELS